MITEEEIVYNTFLFEPCFLCDLFALFDTPRTLWRGEVSDLLSAKQKEGFPNW